MSAATARHTFQVGYRASIGLGYAGVRGGNGGGFIGKYRGGGSGFGSGSSGHETLCLHERRWPGSQHRPRWCDLLRPCGQRRGGLVQRRQPVDHDQLDTGLGGADDHQCRRGHIYGASGEALYGDRIRAPGTVPDGERDVSRRRDLQQRCVAGNAGCRVGWHPPFADNQPSSLVTAGPQGPWTSR